MRKFGRLRLGTLIDRTRSYACVGGSYFSVQAIKDGSLIVRSLFATTDGLGAYDTTNMAHCDAAGRGVHSIGYQASVLARGGSPFTWWGVPLRDAAKRSRVLTAAE